MTGYERRKERKRQSILQAASALFTRHGIKKVSITEIAHAANVNPVTVYNHFHDKVSLVREVVKSAMWGQWEVYSGILESDRPFLEKLEKIVSSKIEMAGLQDGTLFASALEHEEVQRLVESFFESEIYPALRRFFEDGQRNGTVRSDLSITSIETYLDMFTALARVHPELFSHRQGLSESTKEIWSLFLYGLLGRPQRQDEG